MTQTPKHGHSQLAAKVATPTETPAGSQSNGVPTAKGGRDLPFYPDADDPQHLAFSGQANLTYGRVDALLCKLHGMLAQHGIGPGLVVSLQFRDEVVHALCLMAVGRSGATAFCIPKMASQMQRSRMMQEVGSTLILGDNPDEDGTAGYVYLTLPPEETIAPYADRPESPPRGTWLITNSSGSTGKPKLIPVDHQTLSNRLHLYRSALGKSRQDRVASLTGLDLPSTKNQMLSTLFAGATYVFKASERQTLGSFLHDEGITILYTTPAHLHQLLTVPPTEMKSLRAIVAAGAPIGAGLRHRIRDLFGDILFVRYGTSESGPISDATPADAVRIDGTVGKAIAGVQIDILAADGAPLPAGVPGSIRVRSPGLFSGYLGQDAPVAKESGFLTGDLGFLTQDGNLIHLGREDDMILMNGMNIYPAELEQALSEHPAIVAACVRPMPHPVLDAVPIAFVERAPGTQISEHEVLEFCKARLGPRAARRVIVLDHIPRNESGKPNRAALDSLLAEGRLA